MNEIKSTIKENDNSRINSKNIVLQARDLYSKKRSEILNSKDAEYLQNLDKITNKKSLNTILNPNDESFDENLIQANMSYDIQTISKIETSKPKIIRNLVLKFRHIIQNEIRSTLNPIVNNQIKFNIHIVKSVNGLKKILDSVELKQQLRADKIERGISESRESDDTIALYLAYMFYLKRKPTIHEIKTWLPNISNHEKFLDLLNAIEKSEEALQIQKTELQSKGIIVYDSNTAYKKIDDHIIHFYLQDRTYLEPFSQNQLYEPEETILLKKLLKENMNVINIGANIGYFTLLAARQVGPQGKVFAFEPFPKTVELLQKNIDANGYSNVEVIPMAVSNKVGKSRLALKSDTAHNFISEETSEYQTIDVPITTIDNVTNQKIDFIIMDAEGYEPLILDGMSQTLVKNPQIQIITEYNPYTLEIAGSNGENFIKKIEQLGFVMSIIGSKLTSNNAIKEELLKIKYPNTATLYLTKS